MLTSRWSAGIALLLLIGLIFFRAIHAQDNQTERQSGGENLRQPAANDDKEPRLSFNFRFTPWPDVLKWYADKAGLALDLHEVPQGMTFNYYDPKEYSLAETLDVLNGYLIPKGYMLVRRDNFLVSLSLENGVPRSLIPRIALDDLPRHGNNELVSVVLPMAGIDAARVTPEIEKLLSPPGSAVVLPSANSLLLTGLSGDLRRIQMLYGENNLSGDSSATFRAISLKHISAAEADGIVRRLYGLAKDDKASAATPIKMTYESRTNMLLVTAPATDLAAIEVIVRAIDVDSKSADPDSNGARYEPKIRVIKLQGAQANHVEQALKTLLPDRVNVKTIHSPSNNQVQPAPSQSSPEGR